MCSNCMYYMHFLIPRLLSSLTDVLCIGCGVEPGSECADGYIDTTCVQVLVSSLQCSTGHLVSGSDVWVCICRSAIAIIRALSTLL